MSYVGTAHKQGHNAYDAIRKAFSGCLEFIFAEGVLNSYVIKMNTERIPCSNITIGYIRKFGGII